MRFAMHPKVPGTQEGVLRTWVLQPKIQIPIRLQYRGLGLYPDTGNSCKKDIMLLDSNRAARKSFLHVRPVRPYLYAVEIPYGMDLTVPSGTCTCTRSKSPTA